MEDIFSKALDKLKDRPARLDDVGLWLFVTVNTARALIDSCDKSALDNNIFSGCATVREVQYRFDTVQGMYGRRFCGKKNPAYGYLCSLAAFFDERELTKEQAALIHEYYKCSRYLLYEI